MYSSLSSPAVKRQPLSQLPVSYTHLDVYKRQSESTAPHILAMSLVGYPSGNIVTDLGAQGICISAGSACHQGKASHVVSALGLDKKTAAGVIRISFSPDNTEADVDALCRALKSHRDSRFPML